MILALLGVVVFALGLHAFSVSPEALLLDIHQLMYPDVDLGRRGGGPDLLGSARGVLIIVLAYGFLVTAPMVVQGMVFPLVAKTLLVDTRAAGDVVGRVYWVSILGSFVGAFAAGYLLLPFLGVQGGMVGLGVISIVLGLIALRRARTGNSAPARWPWSAVVAAGLVAMAALNPLGVVGLIYAGSGEIVAVNEGITGMVVLKRVAHSEAATVIINGQNHGALAPYNYSRDDAKMALAVNLHPAPRRVLLIGLGNARTLAAVAPYREIEHIDVVEISRELVPALRSQTEIEWLHNALNNPKVEWYLEDGRAFLARTEQRYDIIAMAPVFAHNAYGGYLFSREMFRAVRDRLADDGVFVVLNDSLTPQMRFSLISTFRDVFPYFYLDSGNYLYGMKRPLTPDRERIAASWVLNRDWLQRIPFEHGAATPLAREGAVFTHLRSNQDAFADVQGFPINTDLAPHSEFWLFQHGAEANRLPLPLARRNLAWDLNAPRPEAFTEVWGFDPADLRLDVFTRDLSVTLETIGEGVRLRIPAAGNVKWHTGRGPLGRPPAGDEIGQTPLVPGQAYRFAVFGTGRVPLELQVQVWDAPAQRWKRSAARYVQIDEGVGSVPFVAPVGSPPIRFVVGGRNAGDWKIARLGIYRLADAADATSDELPPGVGE